MKYLLILFFALGCCVQFYAVDRISVTTGDKVRIFQRDVTFGKDVDWSELFYKPYADLAVAPDGTVFVSDSRKHNIKRFDPKGQLTGVFGKRGEGPGDLYSPGSLSILDKRYLLVSEYALRRRFSVFDLKGNFVKVVKIKGSNFGLTALKGGKAAFISNSFIEKSGKAPVKISKIMIIDIHSGKSKEVARFKTILKGFIMLSKNRSISFGNTTGQIQIGTTADGDLLIGKSSENYVDIYDTKGKLKKRLNLKMEKAPVTPEYINRYKADVIVQYQKRGKRFENMVKQIRKADFSNLFDSHHPLYEYFVAADDGSLRFFDFHSRQKRNKKIFKFNMAGRLVETAVLDTGSLGYQVDYRFKRISFRKGSILLYCGETDEEDEFQYKLMRFKLTGFKR